MHFFKLTEKEVIFSFKETKNSKYLVLLPIFEWQNFCPRGFPPWYFTLTKNSFYKWTKHKSEKWSKQKKLF